MNIYRTSIAGDRLSGGRFARELLRERVTRKLHMVMVEMDREKSTQETFGRKGRMGQGGMGY